MYRLICLYFQLTNSLVHFVVEKNLPFRIVDSSALQKLLELVGKRAIKLPSRGSLMKALTGNFEKMRTSMIETFKKQLHLCITCDVWSTRANSFLGMTIHFLTESYDRKSFALAFRPLKTRQTHDKLSLEINKILSDYELAVEQITNMITDGGSAFTKGSKRFGKEDPLTSSQTIDDFPLEDYDEDENEELTNDIRTFPFMQNEDGEVFISNMNSKRRD